MSAVAVSYTVDGAADAPVVVLSNSLGATRAMWDPQVPALAERYRVVSYDARGHGESPAPAGAVPLDDLVDDLVALLDEVGAERAHVAGLSLGGMTALRLAAREPERVDRLAVLCTSAKTDPQPFLDRAAAVRAGGTAPLAPTIAGRWLTPAYAAEHPDLVARLEAMIAGGGRRGLRRLLPRWSPRMDLREDLGRIAAPTLVVAAARTWRCRRSTSRRSPTASRAPSCSPSARAPTWPTWSSRCRSPARCSATSTQRETPR